MKQLVCSVSLLVLALPGVNAQSFDAASIRPSGPQSVVNIAGGPGTKDPGRYIRTKVHLVDLIAKAYDVQRFQVSSRLHLDKDQFDLAATFAPETTSAQFRQMLQHLLKDRFHLVVHTETQSFSSNALVTAKSGSKLREAGDTAEPAPSPYSSILAKMPDLPAGQPNSEMVVTFIGNSIVVIAKARQQPISALIRVLHNANDPVPLIDATGLTGLYDWSFTFESPRNAVAVAASASDAPPEPLPPSGAPDIFAAVQEELGLQIIRQKAPFTVIVVDNIDASPTDN